MYHVYVTCGALYSTAWTADDDMEHEHGAMCTYSRFYYNPTDRYFVNFNFHSNLFNPHEYITHADVRVREWCRGWAGHCGSR